jgi:hypothetical protein
MCAKLLKFNDFTPLSFPVFLVGLKMSTGFRFLALMCQIALGNDVYEKVLISVE